MKRPQEPLFHPLDVTGWDDDDLADQEYMDWSVMQQYYDDFTVWAMGLVSA